MSDSDWPFYDDYEGGFYVLGVTSQGAVYDDGSTVGHTSYGTSAFYIMTLAAMRELATVLMGSLDWTGCDWTTIAASTGLD